MASPLSRSLFPVSLIPWPLLCCGLSKCGRKVRALKSFSVEAAPRVLTLHLKRFAIGGFGGGGFGMGGGGRKIDRWVEFGTELDLSPFLSSHNPSLQKHPPTNKVEPLFTLDSLACLCSSQPQANLCNLG